MLQRDLRRNARAAAARKADRRRWLEKLAKWAACPNSGLTAQVEKLVRKSFNTEPLEIVGSADAPKLVCYHCRSVWHTHTAFTHP